MGMGFAPTWLRQVTPLLHKTTLTTDDESQLPDPLARNGKTSANVDQFSFFFHC